MFGMILFRFVNFFFLRSHWYDSENDELSENVGKVRNDFKNHIYLKHFFEVNIHLLTIFLCFPKPIFKHSSGD